jgi:7-cyano-7-deazaguanine reductase
MGKKSPYQAFLDKQKPAPVPELEVVENRYQDRDYQIQFQIPEFTCVCPKTGLPDFATLRIVYVPDKQLIELKSLKYYIAGYRNMGIFHESVANKVLDDMVKACKPRRMKLEADFNVRGGIHTVVETSYRWK